jgi:outer membrane immunogenic protein
VSRAQRVVKKDFEMCARRYVSAASRALYFLETRTVIRVAGRGESVMKKLLFASAAVVALVAVNAAHAADMGLPAKARTFEPEWNWSGFYAGLNAGYARSTTTWNDLDGFFTAGGTLFNESTNGFIGGGQVGYNWQFRHAVVGIETDFQYLSGSQNTTLFALPPGNLVPTFHDSIQWLGTVRGRAGLAIDNVLTYLTAGLAYGRARHTIVDPFFNVDPNFNLSSTKVGFVAGVGAEYALDPRWSIKTEALYVDLGKNSATITGIAQSTPPGNPTTVTGRFDINDTMWIVRAGVNYKFGG